MSAAAQLAAAFAREHVQEAARLCERAPAAELGAFLAALPADTAAAIAASAAPLAAAEALAQMQAEAAADVVAALEPRVAAALLRRLDSAPAAAVIAKVPARSARQIELLLRYRPDQAASRMDPFVPAVAADTEVEQALQAVRAAAGEAFDYVYVVEGQQRLCGAVSVCALLAAPPSTPIRSAMVANPHSIAAEDSLEAVVVHPGWRVVHALPVIDALGRVLCVTRYAQLRALEAELGTASARAPRADTSAALAELFWLGSTAMARLGEAAIFGRPGRNSEPRS